MALVSVACVGEFEQGAGSASSPSTPGSMAGGGEAPPGPGTAPAAGTNTSGMPGSPLPVADACKSPDPGPQVVRRLNRFEYEATVRDLLDIRGGTAITTDFPAEEKRHGFDNNAAALTVPPLLAEHYMLTAQRVASQWLDGRTDAMITGAYGCAAADPTTPAGQDACARKLVTGLGKNAYRRPLLPEEIDVLVKVFGAGRTNAVAPMTPFRNGVRLVIMTLLQSPQFLYRIEAGQPAAGAATLKLTPHEVATRLSYLLWGRHPDAMLMAAADGNRLGTKEEIAAQVKRLLADPKARAVVSRFHHLWLDLDRLDTAEKDAKIYPKFQKAFLGSMEKETQLFLEEVVWTGAGDLQAMMLAPFTFVDQNLARYYGLTGYMPAVKTDGTTDTLKPVKVMLDGQKRGGLLTQGSLLTILAGGNQTSPVRRGQFVREVLLGQHLPPPPPNAMIELPALDPNLTTRERFSRHSTDAACSGCHSLMDPIGLGFEHFDGAGLWRDTEAGRAVDATGEVVGVPWDGKFDGVLGLAAKLADSPELKESLVRAWFRFGFGREEIEKIDDCTLAQMRQRFAESGFKMQALVAGLTETDMFVYRRAGGGQ